MIKFTYDELADAPVQRSQQIHFNTALDFNAEGDVIGIEVLNVCKRGLDPYAFATQIVSSADAVTVPTPEQVRQGRLARRAADGG